MPMSNQALVKILEAKLDYYEKIDTLTSELAQAFVDNDEKPNEYVMRLVRALAIVHGHYDKK